MSKYAVCEIAGKQYKVEPGKPFDVNLTVEKSLEVPVLMSVDDNKVTVGKPYLKEKFALKVLAQKKGPKIRVAKFHAKANYRRVRGHRAELSTLVWDLPKGKASVKSA